MLMREASGKDFNKDELPERVQSLSELQVLSLETWIILQRFGVDGTGG